VFNKSIAISKIISKTLVLLVLAAGPILSLIGCSAKTQQLATQAKEKMQQVTTIDEDNVLNKVFKDRGKPVPITIENDEAAAAQASFDPSLAADTDLITLNINYKVTVLEGESGLQQKLALVKKPSVVVTSLIPKTIENKQEVLSTHFSIEPSKVYELGNNRYAEFVLENPKGSLDIQVTSKIKLLRNDLSSAKKRGNPNPTEVPVLESYLKEERHIEAKSPAIKDIADSIAGMEEVEVTKNIYDFVKEALEYDHSKAKSDTAKAYGAETVLKVGKGVCVEYADLFVAICRAKGIPAKYVGGITTEGNEENKGHAWAEVYLTDYGWVSVDPTWGDTGASDFDKMRPLYVHLTDVRNDEVLSYSDIYGYKYWGVSANVDFTFSVDSARAKYLEGVLATIDKKKAELAQLKKQLDAAYAEINSVKSELDSIKGSMSQVKSKLDSGAVTDQSEYNSLVDKYNGMIPAHNEKISEYNKKVNAYESLRKNYESQREQVNALVDSYNGMK